MTNAVPGREYTIKIVVGDGGNVRTVDTAVFIKSKGITSGADLKLTVTVDPESITDVADGDTAEFTFKVENIGPAPAWDVELTNSVPVCDDGAWTWSAPEVWHLPDLPSGASFTTNLVVTFGDAAADYWGLTVSGIVVTATGDYDMSNNADEATIEFFSTGSGEIYGRVWDDVNKDGIFSEGAETNLVGVAVSLYTNAVAGIAFATTTTGGDGFYSFGRLPRGEYIVVFDAPDGYNGFSTKHAIADPGVNSDAEAGEPLLRSQTDVLEIAVDGERLENINAGIYRALTIIPARKVWEDGNNQDGIRPDSVTLSLCTNGVVLATADATNGDWSVSWKDFPKYDGTNRIEYIVREDDVPADYTVESEYNGEMWTVVNHHTPSNVIVSVTKVWADDSNRDGIRPREVSFTLFGITDGGASTNLVSTTNILASAYAADANEWPFAWENLPMCAAGEVIVYDVRENDVPRLYTASYATNVLSDDFSFTITNTHTTDVVTVTATKDWDDADNQDGIRPSSVTFSLLSNDVAVATADVSESTGWAASWPNLAANVAGSPIAYGVREDAVPDHYTASVATNGLYDFTVTNTHTTDVVTVTVTKRWEDGDDADGLRPASVTFSLLSNDVAVASVDVSESTGWTASWEGLAERSAGVPIPYGVREDNVPREYAASIVTNGLDFTVTNTHIPDFIEVTATKVWDDADNADGLRPASVTFSLLSNDVAVATADVSESTGWAASWPNLAANVAGSPIAYGVREDAVPDGYTASVVTNGLYDFTVTNTHERAVITVTAKKIWEDADNQDGLRPDSVTLTLATNGVAIVTGDVSAFNEWKVTWANLAANAAGSPIAYEVLEETVPNGYEVAIEEGADHVFTVINTHVPDTLDVTATKVWEDANDQDGIRPASVTFALLSNGVSVATSDVSADVGWTTSWTNLSVYAAGQSIAWTVAEDTDLSPDYFTTVSKNGNDWTITNTHTTDVVTVTVQKIWDDADDRDGIRPDSVTFALVSNNVSVATAAVSADTGWTNAWTGLSKRSAGTSIAWTVQEENLSSDYTLVSTENNDNDWIFTNQHIPETVDVIATKVWDDADNQDGIRPASVTFSLLSNDVAVATADVSESIGWAASWTNLAANVAGSPIVYGIREDAVPDGYTASVATNGLAFAITNTHTTDVVTVTVQKIWDDADDQDGIRPDSVTFALVSNNVSVATAAVSADTGWTNAWTGLSKRSAGTSIAWTVQEENLSSDYTLVSTESNGNDWTFTNQHIPETIDITVVKVWDDEDDAEGLRPASVSVTLLAGTAEVGTVDLDEAGVWTFAWTNLAKCASGSAIAYSVRENDVPAEYTCSVARSGDTFTVTNTHSTGAPELKTTAKWTLNRSDGLIDGTFTLKNVGNKPFAANTDFWLATPGSRPTWDLRNRTGRMPDGSDYYNFTVAVRAAVKKVGNKNAVLDPGESVVVTGVKMYHKSRISPDKYLNVQASTHAGRLFHVSDTNRDFILSASELTAAQSAWSAGSLSDDDFLEATRLNGGVAYLWDDTARNWATLSEDKR